METIELVQPFETYNLLQLISCFLLIAWGFWSLERFTNAFRIRASILAGQQVALSGLGDIVSDSFSFLDQGADELSAKGDGGLRQIHQYSTLNQVDSITTPEETYQANTIGNQNIDMDTLRRQRDNEINIQ